MSSQPDDVASKLKSHLKVYEDLLRDQAAEIASLKAEVAYLKKQVLVEPQNEGPAGKAIAAQLPARNTSKVNSALLKTPPASINSSRDQGVIELEDSEEESFKRSRRTSPAKRPKKRESSPALADLPKKSRKRTRGWLADESPKKKPKLALEVVIPRWTPQRLSSYTKFQATSAAAATNVSSGTLDDYDDWDLSSLSSLSSTPSRPSTPSPGEDFGRSPPNYLDLSNSLSALKEAPRQPLHNQNALFQSSSHGNIDRSSNPGQTADHSAGPSDNAAAGSSTALKKAPPMPPRTPRLRTRPPAPPSPTSPTSPQQNERLAGAATFEVVVADPALLRVAVNRKQTSSIFGGSFLPMCVRTAGRDFLYPRVDMNPLLPRAAGRPGLIYRGGDGPGWHWKGDVQTLFVGVRNGAYKYFGEYRMALAAPLSVEEYCAMGYELKKKWAKGMARKSKYKDIRVRIVTRRDKGREATAEEIALVVANRSDKYDDKLTIDDIIDAYTRGEQKLFVWRMECVDFDEAFLKRLVSKL